MILHGGHRKEEEPSDVPGRWQGVTEILINIFEYLPLEDRKNAKLVCDSWYNILTRRSFQVKECIHCHGLLYSTIEIVSRLRAFRCPLYNLKLQKVNVKDWPQKFWRERGNEIRELKFVGRHNIHMYVDDKSIEDIIEYCTNLTHWSDTNYFTNDFANAVSEHLLDTLIEKNILRSNLISMNTHVRKLNQSWLLKLFTIFPKIRKLHLQERNSDNNVPNHNIFKTLGQYNYIRDSLSYSNWSLSMNELFSTVPSSSCTMLQHLKIGFITSGTRLEHAENFLSFISKLTTLKSFHVEFRKRKRSAFIPLKTLVTKLFHTLLDHCMDLHTLKCEMILSSITLDTRLLAKLVKSKLVNLDIASLTLDRDLSPHFVNDTLKCLNISYAKGTADSKPLWSSFVHIFRGLIHCRISFAYDIETEIDVLEGIDAHTTKLVSLSIEFHVDDEQMLSSKFLCLSMFTRLRYLNVYLPGSAKILKSWLNLPNLEYLYIDYAECSVSSPPPTVDCDYLNTIANYSPKLKLLRVFNVQSVTYPLIEKVCTSLSKLQFLFISYYTIVEKFGVSEIEKLFSSSQSLRVVYLHSRSADRDPTNPVQDDILVSYNPTREWFKSATYDHCETVLFDTSESARFQFDMRLF